MAFVDDLSDYGGAQRGVIIDALAAHYEKFFCSRAPDDDDNAVDGNSYKVFSSRVGAVDLLCFPPDQALDRDFWTIATVGLSGRQQGLAPCPCGTANCQNLVDERVELMCYLPPHWRFPSKLDGGAMTADNWCVCAWVCVCLAELIRTARGSITEICATVRWRT